MDSLNPADGGSTLRGRRVLVTGGAVRVGRAIVEHLAAVGAHVAVHYHTHAREAGELAARLLGAGLRSRAIAADLRDPEQAESAVAQAADALGGLDCIVHNASIFRPTPVDTLCERDWADYLGVHLLGPWHLIRAALPSLRASARASIVAIVDLSAWRPWPRYVAHSVSKAALLALVRSLAVALAPDRIAVNAVAPGNVLWPDDVPAELRDREAARTPAGDVGTPADVARAVAYLLSAGPFVTGTTLTVDGGRSLR